MGGGGVIGLFFQTNVSEPLQKEIVLPSFDKLLPLEPISFILFYTIVSKRVIGNRIGAHWLGGREDFNLASLDKDIFNFIGPDLMMMIGIAMDQYKLNQYKFRRSVDLHYYVISFQNKEPISMIVIQTTDTFMF